MRVERRASLAQRGARHSGGDRQMGHERKLKRRDKCSKTVQNARGDGNSARAQEGGGRGETRNLACSTITDYSTGHDRPTCLATIYRN
jgi:hypothetical protein